MNSQVYEEASDWVVQHRSGTLDMNARRRFDAWLRESPQHVRAYLEMSSIWEGITVLDPSWNLSADELIARARAESNVHPLPERPAERLAEAPPEPGLDVAAARTRGPSRHLYAIAASVLIAVCLASWAYLEQRNVYSTGIGELRTITLADGSSVELNALTKVRVRYTEHERDIDLLRGQALFRVAKNHARPFVVASNSTQIRAVGTQFDVYRKTDGTLVTVVEGRVAVSATHLSSLSSFPSSEFADAPPPSDSGGQSQRSGERRPSSQVPSKGTNNRQGGEAARTEANFARPGEVLLVAGEQLLVAQAEQAPKTAGATPKPANLEAATAWTEQRLVFDNSSLTEVVEEFNRYNHRRLVIDDDSLKDFHISGTFSSTDPSLLLRFLRDQPEVAVNETSDEIRISRRQGAG